MDHICQTGKEAQHLPPWQDKVTNAEVLSRAGLPSMYTLVRQRRLRWLGHFRRMEDGRIPKDILSGEHATGQRSIGRPHLRFKDVCKRDVRALDIDTEPWKDLAADRGSWRNTLHKQLNLGEEKLIAMVDEQRAREKDSINRPVTLHKFHFSD